MKRPTNFRHKAKKLLAEGAWVSPDSVLNALPSTSSAALMYHRVIEPKDVPWEMEPGMFVTPKSFRLQLEFLAERYNVIPLEDYVTQTLEDRLEPGSISLTFDDGWKDFKDLAAPVLEEFGFTATVFLPTSFIDSKELFWTDKLSLAVGNCPDKLVELFSDYKIFTPADGPNPDSLLSRKNMTLERAIFTLRAASPVNRGRIIAELEKELPEIERQFLNWKEINQLADRGFTFGSHSHLHRASTEVESSDLEQDFKKSKETLSSKLTSGKLDIFCYPGGYYDSATQEVASTVGFTAAMAIHRKNSPSSPPLIGRIGIHEDISYTKKLFNFRLKF